MPSPFRLLGVFAHPDDESLGCGGALARYAAEGVETHVLTATRGERGRIGRDRPGAEIVAPLRESELRAAADELGVHDVRLLDYLDGELGRADPLEATARIAAHVRRIRPHVVVTFAVDGAYGHPDHVAVSQLTSSALVAAADPGFLPPAGIELPPAAHRVAKLYWMAWDEPAYRLYQEAIGGDLVSRVEGGERRAVAWPEWAITTRIDATAHWQTVWRAVQCHQSQITGYGGLAELGPERHRELWGCGQTFVRVYSMVDCGAPPETDLFAGLRAGAR